VHRLVRAFLAVTIAFTLIQPAFAATPANGDLVSQATSSTTGGVSGTVDDQTGAPVSGATITMRGPATLHATSDAKGQFTIDNAPPGLYLIDVSKPGYQAVLEPDYAVIAGQVSSVAVTIQAATFSSLRTIATVRAVGRGAFNTSTAAVSTVSQQDFVNQGATGLGSVLNQIPGLQVSLPNNDGNGASPGAITFANIRNGLGFETATEIDGHPLSVGKYGDYVLSFWTPFMFQSYEVVKGPGADALQTNFAINGVLNMRTLDPTEKFTPTYLFGYTNTGGTYWNFGASGTTGRLGFVADIAQVNEPSVIQGSGASVYIGEQPGGVAHINGTTDVLTYNNALGVIPGTNGTAANYNIYNLLACCYTVSGSIYKLNELLKLRYRFSQATTATVSYLGAQATSDENGDTSQLVPSVFQPGAGYTGPVQPGAQFLVGNVYPGGDIETNNEPMFQAEISSTIGQDTVLARYYHASIYRLLNEGNSNPNIPVTIYQTLNGYNEYGQTYNNVTVPVDWYDYYYQSESDQLGGVDLQYQHPYGEGNNVTLSFSQTHSTTGYWYEEETTNYNGANQFVGATEDEPDVSIPEGSGENFTTVRASATQNFGEKLNALVTLYDNLYQYTYATTCGAGASSTAANACAVSGSNATFTTQNTAHFDERAGLTYRPTNDLIFRAAAGSSIAPPYINVLSRFSTVPDWNGASPTVTINEANPNLVPETAFGYDLGADWRVRQNYFVSVDAYETNLYNQFLLTTVDSGTTCTKTNYPTSNCPAAGTLLPYPPPELYYSIYGNVNNSRYEGIELALKRIVQKGIGFLVQGSTQRGYAYNLGSNFYCNFGPSSTQPCTPANYNQNLAVIAGQNFNGGSDMYFHSASCTSTNPTSSAYWCAEGNNVSNQSVPYLQGYAELNWHSGDGWYASFGGTLFGKNNSYNEPPFTVYRATLRVPLTKTLSFQVSGYNVFNAYRQLFPIVSGGVAIPLANGAIGPTNANVIGPAQYNFALTKTLAE